MSPDEMTLVEAAKQIGYEYRNRTSNEIKIKIKGQKKVYKLLELFKFTSERKRMTVVVQDPEDKNYAIVYTKGADTVMKELAEPDQPWFKYKYVHDFSIKGFR